KRQIMTFCCAANHIYVTKGTPRSRRRRGTHRLRLVKLQSDSDTSKPWPIFTVMMNAPQAAMYPPRTYAGKESADISKNPIGTGPYKFVRWSKDEEIMLEANPNFWRGASKIKTVVFRPIPDDAVRVAALQNGEVDVAVNIPPHLAAIIDKHPKVFLSTAPSIRTIQLMFYTHQYDKDDKLVGPYQGP